VTAVSAMADEVVTGVGETSATETNATATVRAVRSAFCAANGVVTPVKTSMVHCVYAAKLPLATAKAIVADTVPELELLVVKARV